MPRFARIVSPGCVVHVISRFVNKEFRLAGRRHRREYLRRAAQISERVDWKPLAYALMSSHIHWVMWSGRDPLAGFFKPLNTGFALWLNKREERLGPVFAGRPSVSIASGTTAIALFAYVHNNPVRAGVVEAAADSDWTSHRAFTDPLLTPDWLDVERAYTTMALPWDHASRHAFDRLVRERASEPKDPLWRGEPRAERTAIRKLLRAPVELGTPHVLEADGVGRASLPLVAHTTPARSKLPVSSADPHSVIASVAAVLDLPEHQVTGGSRVRRMVEARKLCLLVWRDELGLPAVRMASALGIGESSASKLYRKGREDQDLKPHLARMMAAFDVGVRRAEGKK